MRNERKDFCSMSTIMELLMFVALLMLFVSCGYDESEEAAIEERPLNEAKKVMSFEVDRKMSGASHMNVFEVEIDGHTYYYVDGWRRSGLAPTPETIRNATAASPRTESE